MVAQWLSFDYIHSGPSAVDSSIVIHNSWMDWWSLVLNTSWYCHFLLLQSVISHLGPLCTAWSSSTSLPRHGHSYFRSLLYLSFPSFWGSVCIILFIFILYNNLILNFIDAYRTQMVQVLCGPTSVGYMLWCSYYWSSCGRAKPQGQKTMQNGHQLMASLISSIKFCSFIYFNQFLKVSFLFYFITYIFV